MKTLHAAGRAPDEALGQLTQREMHGARLRCRRLVGRFSVRWIHRSRARHGKITEDEFDLAALISRSSRGGRRNEALFAGLLAPPRARTSVDGCGTRKRGARATELREASEEGVRAGAGRRDVELAARHHGVLRFPLDRAGQRERADAIWQRAPRTPRAALRRRPRRRSSHGPAPTPLPCSAAKSASQPVPASTRVDRGAIARRERRVALAQPLQALPLIRERLLHPRRARRSCTRPARRRARAPSALASRNGA